MRINVNGVSLFFDTEGSKSIEGSEEMVACLPPDLVRFVRFPECGHNVLREQPEEALAAIEEFIHASAS